MIPLFASRNDDTNFAMPQLPLRTTNLDLILHHVAHRIVIHDRLGPENHHLKQSPLNREFLPTKSNVSMG
jgi:hypothetical protein